MPVISASQNKVFKSAQESEKPETSKIIGKLNVEKFLLKLVRNLSV